MDVNMNFNDTALMYSLSLLAGIIVFLKAGHLMGRRKHLANESTSGSALDGVVFALLGLLLAFSFSSATNSYGAYRNLLAQEANNIYDLYQKSDLVDEQKQKAIRALLRDYAEARLIATEAPMASAEENIALGRAFEIQNQLWRLISQEIKASSNPTAANQIVTAFNSISSVYDAQVAEQRNRIPKVIYGLFFLLALFAALIAGHSMADLPTLPHLRSLIFSASVTVTVYTIIDMGTPRTGFFNSVSVNYMLRDIIKILQ